MFFLRLQFDRLGQRLGDDGDDKAATLRYTGQGYWGPTDHRPPIEP